MRNALIAILVLLLGWGVISTWQHRELKQPPGVLAPDAPLQENLGDDVPVLQRDDVTLTPRAHFVVTARVLSRDDYSLAPTPS